MTIQDFNSMNLEQQQSALLKSGIYLAERKDPPLKMMLYQMHGFYVEVFFLSRFHKVGWFKAFNSTNEIEPYLEKIDISSLLHEVLS